jgi:hypothetical protein
MLCSSAASSPFNPPTAAIHNPLVPPFISVTGCRQKNLRKPSVQFIADSPPVQRVFFRASTRSTRAIQRASSFQLITGCANFLLNPDCQHQSFCK